MRRNPFVAGIAGAAALLLASGGAPAVAEAAASTGDAYSVEQFDLKQPDDGAVFRIHLAIPEGTAPAAGYPTVFLIDGNATFPMFREAQRASQAEPSIVVGIGHPSDQRFDVQRRYYELTPPTPPDRIPRRDGGPAPRTGGRDAFLAFIQDTLKPEIARRAPVDPGRMSLFGHSLGGLFTLHVLFSTPDAFSAYVASDPSVWWNGHAALEDMEAFRAARRPDAKAARLLIETSGKRVDRPGVTAEQMARINELRGGPNGADVAERLKGTPSLEVSYRHLPTETHGSMLKVVVDDAVRFFR